jgi:hypothetical protein
MSSTSSESGDLGPTGTPHPGQRRDRGMRRLARAVATGADCSRDDLNKARDRMLKTLANPDASERDCAIATRALMDIARIEQASIDLELTCEEHDDMLERLDKLEGDVTKSDAK